MEERQKIIKSTFYCADDMKFKDKIRFVKVIAS